jgi:hypothetical protein
MKKKQESFEQNIINGEMILDKYARSLRDIEEEAQL